MTGADTHSDGSSLGQALPAPTTKPRQTCMQCRARKVRCDGRLDFCGNCDRLGYECSFRTPDVSGSGRGSGSHPSSLPTRTVKGRRVTRACKDCHLAKSRCSGTLPACQRCTSKGIECVYPQSRAGRRAVDASSPLQQHLSQSSAESPGHEDIVMPEVPELQQLPSPYDTFEAACPVCTGYQNKYALLTHERVTSAMRSFFDHLHSLPSLAFLQRPSLMTFYRKQEADPALIAAIVAISSRLPGTTPEESNTGFQCADLTEELVGAAFKQPSMFRIQALLLLLRFRLWTSSANDPLLLMAQLARSAFLLRLNYETLQSSFFVQESRRRLMWAIYMLDVVLADGLQEYTSCPITAIHLRLPCMEDDFELGGENQSEKVNQGGSSPPRRLGIIGFYIRVVHLNDEILRYIKGLLNLKSESNIEREFSQLEKNLEAFHSRLPPHERFSQKNLALRAFSPRLSRFVMTHIWWHWCHCQLFRSLLPTIPETFSPRLASSLGDSLVVGYQKKCLGHAVRIVSILSALTDLNSDTCILDLDMAECVFKTSQILLVSGDSTRNQLGLGHDDILRHVSVCLRFTESMLEMYPVLGPMVSDLTGAVHSFAQGDASLAAFFTTAQQAQVSPRQAISRHGALYRGSFVDDSSKMDIHDSIYDNDEDDHASQRQDTTQADGTTTNMQVAASNNHKDRFLGAYTGLERLPDACGPDNAFHWPDMVSGRWDQVSLFQNFQGPFDGDGNEPSVEAGLSPMVAFDHRDDARASGPDPGSG